MRETGTDAPVTDPPVLYCPIAPAVHPQAERIEAECRAWLAAWGLFADEAGRARLAGARAGELAARVLPRGSSEGVRLVADYRMWLFAFDDLAGAGTAAHRSWPGLATASCRLRRVLDAPWADPGGDPWARALRELRLRVEALATPVQLDRWIAATGHYLAGLAWEGAHRRTGATPSLNDWAVHHLHSGAAPACVALLDVVEGYELPTAQALRPEIRALTEMCATLVAWDGDIVARARGVSRPGDRRDLVDLTAREYGCPPAQALLRAVAGRDRVMQRFQALRARVEPGAPEPVRRYLAGLSTWVRGHLDWSVRPDGYRRGGVLTPGRVRLSGRPSAPDDRPLPLPALAWWWRMPGDAPARR
ncbi:terpene synthase family protein [Streptomyces marincola]|uniref:Terpene synthase n=1 Tax=Streptomyces marincola TaxID=2878388 RepID=A0A1W7D0K8_9ACTN|nr:hypothetical protein [Streptomyces marincola]ARQ70542.1 hypothetical protein CAG99_18350 [Streptomyces marincola]